MPGHGRAREVRVDAAGPLLHELVARGPRHGARVRGARRRVVLLLRAVVALLRGLWGGDGRRVPGLGLERGLAVLLGLLRVLHGLLRLCPLRRKLLCGPLLRLLARRDGVVHGVLGLRLRGLGLGLLCGELVLSLLRLFARLYQAVDCLVVLARDDVQVVHGAYQVVEVLCGQQHVYEAVARLRELVGRVDGARGLALKLRHLRVQVVQLLLVRVDVRLHVLEVLRRGVVVLAGLLYLRLQIRGLVRLCGRGKRVRPDAKQQPGNQDGRRQSHRPSCHESPNFRQSSRRVITALFYLGNAIYMLPS